MPQVTDLKEGTGAHSALSPETALILAAVAQHFTEVNPTADLGQHSLLVSFGAEAYRFTDGKPGRNADGMAAAAYSAAPRFSPPVTRGEYALILRRVLTDAGVEWTEDDNQPAIPRVPGPRTEPVPGPLPRIPAQPRGSDAPTCCGRAMKRDGPQWVCGKCKGWHDLGGGK